MGKSTGNETFRFDLFGLTSASEVSSFDLLSFSKISKHKLLFFLDFLIFLKFRFEFFSILLLGSLGSLEGFLAVFSLLLDVALEVE